MYTILKDKTRFFLSIINGHAAPRGVLGYQQAALAAELPPAAPTADSIHLRPLRPLTPTIPKGGSCNTISKGLEPSGKPRPLRIMEAIGGGGRGGGA